MNKLIVSYDLRKAGQNYEDLINKIKSFTSFSKITESCWLINTNKNCVEARDILLKTIDSNDRLFVGKLTGEAAWRNCIDTTDNIKKNL